MKVFLKEITQNRHDLVAEAFSKKQWIEIVEAVEDCDMLWCDYDEIPWDSVIGDGKTANSYCIRKGIIRKSNMALLCEQYQVKHPDSLLARSIPPSYVIELLESDYIDEALCELPAEVVINEAQVPWIVKPALVEKANSLMIFTTTEQLREYLERDESRDASQFVVQRYVDRPLLLRGRKFHLRAHVLAVGNLKEPKAGSIKSMDLGVRMEFGMVFVHDDLFVLSALKPFEAGNYTDFYSHVTNTSVMKTHQDWDSDSVKCILPLSSQAEELGANVVGTIAANVRQVVGALFQAVHTEMTTFFPLPHCFELYGVDLLVDEDHNVWLLEVNAGPEVFMGSEYHANGVRLFGDIADTVLHPMHANSNQWPKLEAFTGTGGFSSGPVYERKIDFMNGTQSKMAVYD